VTGRYAVVQLLQQRRARDKARFAIWGPAHLNLIELQF